MGEKLQWVATVVTVGRISPRGPPRLPTWNFPGDPSAVPHQPNATPSISQQPEELSTSGLHRWNQHTKLRRSRVSWARSGVNFKGGNFF